MTQAQTLFQAQTGGFTPVLFFLRAAWLGLVCLIALVCVGCETKSQPVTKDAVALADDALAAIDKESKTARRTILERDKPRFLAQMTHAEHEADETRELRQRHLRLWEEILVPAKLHYENQLKKLEYVNKHAEAIRAVLVPKIKANTLRASSLNPYVQATLMADYETEVEKKLRHDREQIAVFAAELERWERSFLSGTLDYRLPSKTKPSGMDNSTNDAAKSP